MKSKTVALVIFYTDSNKILLQDRRDMDSWGAEWGFWGGKVKEGETVEQAAKREIKEELNYELKNPKYFGRFLDTRAKPGTDEIWKITLEVFTEKISEDMDQFEVLEGAGIGKFTIEEAKKLKMTPMDLRVLDSMQEFLSKRS